jgi:hypothetical protein
MPLPRSREFLVGIAKDDKRATSHRLLALTLLARNHGKAALAEVESGLGAGTHALVKGAVAFYLAATGGEDPGVQLTVKLKDGGSMATAVVATDGEKLMVRGSEDFPGLKDLRLPRASIEEIQVTAPQPPAAADGVVLLLKTGTRLAVKSLTMQGDVITAESLGRKLRLDRGMVRGVLPDPSRGRALGGSRQSDQVRLVEGDPKLIEGDVTAMDDTSVTIDGKGGKGDKRQLPWKSVEVMLFKLETAKGSLEGVGDVNQYVQVDLASGERVVGMLLDLGPGKIALASDSLGCFELPLQQVATLQLSNSGRALTGFTLVTDYGNTKVVEFDGEGREVWKLEDLFDPVDAHRTPAGTVLITEQGDNAVREYDTGGKVLWQYTG